MIAFSFQVVGFIWFVLSALGMSTAGVLADYSLILYKTFIVNVIFALFLMFTSMFGVWAVLGQKKKAIGVV